MTTPTHSSRRWQVRGLAVLTAGLIAVLGAEAVLRVHLWRRGWTANCYASHLDMFLPDESRGYVLRPGFRLQSGTHRMSVNALGLRGPETTVAKPRGTIRVLLIGGSGAYGYLVSDGLEAARQLEPRLASPGVPVEVINGGVSGYNLFQSLADLRLRLLEFSPDILIAYVGWNDMKYLASEDPAAHVHQQLPVAPAWERAAGRTALYGFITYRLFGKGLQLVPVDFAPRATPAGESQFQKNLQELLTLTRERKVQLLLCRQASVAMPAASAEVRTWIGSNAEQQEAMIALWQRVGELLANFSQRNRLPYLDGSDAIPPTTEMFGDGVHLTPVGEVRLAALFAEKLRPMMTAARTKNRTGPPKPAAESVHSSKLDDIH